MTSVTELAKVFTLLGGVTTV